MNILLNWIKPNLNFWIDFWIEFFGKKSYWIIFWIEYSWKKWYWIIPWIEFYREMNEWIIFWIDICHFWWKVPFFVYFGHFLDNFRALFLFDQYQRVPDYWIELSFELNQQNFFELNNILNWILGKAILNRILNESFFGKIQILNWIRLGIVNH